MQYASEIFYLSFARFYFYFFLKNGKAHRQEHSQNEAAKSK